MQLSDVFVGLGQENLAQLLREVSLGKLKTYQLFDRVKTRLHLAKLNQEHLRKCAPKLWERLGAKDEELASDLSQAVLVSHLDMLVAVLDLLEIPHNEGFFDKDAEIAAKLTTGWQERVYGAFQDRFPKAVLVFYVNHLAHEVAGATEVYRPAQ
ncbi:MAG: hypothetical protein JJE04_15225 [Acidobacteriia bacterium]|nr:hypothetical protein [Terriglobia bacterium]